MKIKELMEILGEAKDHNVEIGVEIPEGKCVYHGEKEDVRGIERVEVINSVNPKFRIVLKSQ